MTDPQTHVQKLQSLDAGTISKRRLMELDPLIESVPEELVRIQREQLEDLLFEAARGRTVVAVEWVAKAIQAVEQGADLAVWALANPPLMTRV